MNPASPDRVGLALIAKDEAARLPTLLASIEGAFDRVVLLDTGSTDDTKEVFVKWAKSQSACSYSVGDYVWKDDFADCRTVADQLLTGTPTSPLVEWKCWADCDDVINGSQNIRQLVNSAPPNVVAFMVDYDYARHPDNGQCLSYLRRERVVRVGHGTWAGRVHEAQLINSGQVQMVDPGVLLYVHMKDGTHEEAGKSNGRNLRILNQWYADEPDNPRVLSYLGVENALNGDHKTAIGYYNAYLEKETGWDEERAQVYSRLASSYIATECFEDAIVTALEAFRVIPSWPDTYIRLAEAHLARNENEKAEQWARLAMERGAPEGTLLIVNPLDYSFQPFKLLAGALGNQGKIHEAIDIGRRALSVCNDDALGQAMHIWQGTAKRERTADTFAMCAEQLIAHDEQLKALTLLEDCVPVFATDHPRVVALRSMLRERIGWAWDSDAYSSHYEVGGSKPEDMIPDDKVDSLCEALPRTNFLLDGICEQLEIT